MAIAETAFEEVRSAASVAGALERAGFEVEIGCGRRTWGPLRAAPCPEWAAEGRTVIAAAVCRT